MFSHSFSRHLLARRATVSLACNARGAVPLWTGRVLEARRSVMSAAQLTPVEDLSEARQRLRHVLDDYRHKKYVCVLGCLLRQESLLSPLSLLGALRVRMAGRSFLQSLILDYCPHQLTLVHFGNTALDKRSFLAFSRK